MSVRVGVGGHAGPLWVSASTTLRSGKFWRVAISTFTSMVMVYLIVTGDFGWTATTLGVGLGLLGAVRDRRRRGRRARRL
jgi:hypothetical protein